MRRVPVDVILSVIGCVALVTLWSTGRWPLVVDAVFVVVSFFLLVPLIRFLLAKAAHSLRADASDPTHRHPPAGPGS